MLHEPEAVVEIDGAEARQLEQDEQLSNHSPVSRSPASFRSDWILDRSKRSGATVLTLGAMNDAWQILRDGGLPLALPASGRSRSSQELATATRAAIAQQPTGRDAEALAAFVFAWHHHWPGSFEHELGADADAVVAWAARNTLDQGRYLKLRRIALENLAHIL